MAVWASLVCRWRAARALVNSSAITLDSDRGNRMLGMLLVNLCCEYRLKYQCSVRLTQRTLQVASQIFFQRPQKNRAFLATTITKRLREILYGLNTEQFTKQLDRNLDLQIRERFSQCFSSIYLVPFHSLILIHSEENKQAWFEIF